MRVIRPRYHCPITRISNTPTSASPRIYLQGIDNTEIIDTVHARRAPMVPVDSSLRR